MGIELVEHLEQETPVYNFEVLEHHNYFVSPLSLLVHNKDVICDIQKALENGKTPKELLDSGKYSVDELLNARVDPKEIQDWIEKASGANKTKLKRTPAELDDLARDPSHGGNITKGSELERDIGLALEERGDLGHIVRDKVVDGGAEFIDTVTGKNMMLRALFHIRMVILLLKKELLQLIEQ